MNIPEQERSKAESAVFEEDEEVLRVVAPVPAMPLDVGWDTLVEDEPELESASSGDEEPEIEGSDPDDWLAD